MLTFIRKTEVLILGGILYAALLSSCSKSNTDPLPEEHCRLDSVWTKLDPSYPSHQRLIYYYDTQDRLSRKEDPGLGEVMQSQVYYYDSAGRLMRITSLGRYNALQAESTCFYDTQSKPLGRLLYNNLVSPAETDSFHYSFSSGKIIDLRRTNNVNEHQLDYEFENGNLVRRVQKFNDVLSFIDSIAYTSMPASPDDLIEKDDFIASSLKSKNLPLRRIFFNVVQNSRVMDDSYEYEFDDHGHVIKRITRSNMPPNPYFPGNEKVETYFWKCD